MILGNADSWAQHFKRHDDRLLERICEILPDCVAMLSSNPLEDEITFNLVSRFRLDAVIRTIFHHWEYQYGVRSLHKLIMSGLSQSPPRAPA